MKKINFLFLAAAMLLSLAACGGGQAGGTSAQTTRDTAADAVQTTAQTTSQDNLPTSADFSFNGSVSEQVLKNYLSRSINYSFFEAGRNVDEDIAAIVDMGAKYVARATIVWYAGGFELGRADNYRAQIDKLHALDPDVVLEACVFETTSTLASEIPIPEYVFRAFGLEPEERNFSYEDMLYTDGRYVDHWQPGASVPDITRLETQMFMYWHATFYIDAGFEGLHWGQVHLMGENDTDFAAWT